VPPLALLAARSLAHGRPICVLLLLLVPLIRFAPGYVRVAQNQTNPDLALFADTQRAAREIPPGESLFVWGYRPELYVLTRAPLGTPYLESQPLTGVFADRHLVSAQPSDYEQTERHLARLARTQPTWIADGLGPLNPALGIATRPTLTPWLAQYQLVKTWPTLKLYRRRK